MLTVWTLVLSVKENVREMDSLDIADLKTLGPMTTRIKHKGNVHQNYAPRKHDIVIANSYFARLQISIEYSTVALSNSKKGS